MDGRALVANIERFAQTCSFQDEFRKSVSVVSDALRLYGPRALALSFSGGKEACVLLFLLKYCLLRAGLDERALSRDIKIIYFTDADTFPEVEAFLSSIRRDLGIELTALSCSYKDGMEAAVSTMGVRAILMGVRVGDPYASSVEHFQPSSPSWPAFMRVNAVMHWRYGQVWEFLRSCELPYCSLYDQGYTSLGNRKNTVRNERLRVAGPDGETYLPAYRLPADDEHLERSNRSPADPAAAREQPTAAGPVVAAGAMAVRVIGAAVPACCALLLDLQRTLEQIGGVVSSVDMQVIPGDSASQAEARHRAVLDACSGTCLVLSEGRGMPPALTGLLAGRGGADDAQDTQEGHWGHATVGKALLLLQLAEGGPEGCGNSCRAAIERFIAVAPNSPN